MKRARGTRKRRADADRNVEAILDAAVRSFGRRPDASMSDIAAAAGVGRVTLYAHFPSREALLGAAIDRAAADVMTTIDAAGIDDGPAREALGRLIRAEWSTLDWFWGLHVAAHGQSPTFVREHSAPFLARVDGLIARGQAEGSFRADLPREWLVAAFYALIHAAGEEVSDGRLDPAAAARVLEATLIGLLAA
jgi:TetR/AcrR family transcriptional repressor of mexCD-oprJ operon